MNLEIDQLIFNWLVNLLVLKPSPAYKALMNNKIALDEKTTHSFESGGAFLTILKNLKKVSEKVFFYVLIFLQLLGE